MLGYTREVGNGGVTYFALGHCHNPAIRAARAPDPADTTPPTFRGSWETERVHHVAAQRHRLGCGRLIARGGNQTAAINTLGSPHPAQMTGGLALGARLGADRLWRSARTARTIDGVEPPLFRSRS